VPQHRSSTRAPGRPSVSRDPLDETGAPTAVEIERQEMIQQVIVAGDAPEHPGEPSSRPPVLRSLRAAWLPSREKPLRSIRARCDRQRPKTIFTSPILTGRTKCTLPWTVFLSAAKRSIKPLTGHAGKRRDRPVLRDDFQDRLPRPRPGGCRSARPKSWRRAFQRRPPRHAGISSTAFPLRARDRWCGRKFRMRRRSPFAFIRGNHFGLDAHGAGDDLFYDGWFLRKHAGRTLIQQLEQFGVRG